MLWTIAIIFSLVWVLGLVTGCTLGGYVHVLAGVAVVLLLIAVYKAATRAERRRGASISRKSAAPVKGADGGDPHLGGGHRGGGRA